MPRRQVDPHERRSGHLLSLRVAARLGAAGRAVAHRRRRSRDVLPGLPRGCPGDRRRRSRAVLPASCRVRGIAAAGRARRTGRLRRSGLPAGLRPSAGWRRARGGAAARGPGLCGLRVAGGAHAGRDAGRERRRGELRHRSRAGEVVADLHVALRGAGGRGRGGLPSPPVRCLARRGAASARAFAGAGRAGDRRPRDDAGDDVRGPGVDRRRADDAGDREPDALGRAAADAAGPAVFRSAAVRRRLARTAGASARHGRPGLPGDRRRLRREPPLDVHGGRTGVLRLGDHVRVPPAGSPLRRVAGACPRRARPTSWPGSFPPARIGCRPGRGRMPSRTWP